MSDRLISIIIPIYNCEKTLERCLNSVREQSYSNIEVIMINDGSTDSSGEICKRFCEEDERFRYFYQENSGVSVARNHGLKERRGEFYTFIDSDDWVEADYCRKTYDKATEEQSDMVLCGINFIREGKKYPRDESAAIEDIIRNGNVEHFLTEVKVKAMGSIWRVLYRSSKLGDLRFDENLHIYEDLIYLLENVGRAEKLSYVNEYLYNYDVPRVPYMRKYYRPEIVETCYLIGVKLQDILNRLDREDWGKAELFKQYYNASIWVLACGKNDKRSLRTLKKHGGLKEFNCKENYKLYKNLYKHNKLKAFLIHNRMFLTYRILSAVKKLFRN